MKTYIVGVLLASLVFPLGALAQGVMMDFNDIHTGPEMMRYLEEGAVGSEAHEEMESLMIKMLTGNLAQDEAERMISFMDEYPGPSTMMMNRLGVGASPWMMGGGFTTWHWVLSLLGLVWLVAGILLSVWLVQQIQKK